MILEKCYSSSISALQLNIKSIFEKNAKLDKMMAKTSGWTVSEIVHKARIEMNEEGAEGAGFSGEYSGKRSTIDSDDRNSSK